MRGVTPAVGSTIETDAGRAVVECAGRGEVLARVGCVALWFRFDGRRWVQKP